MSTVAVVDYGMGNRRSVEKAFEHVGAEVRVTGDHDAIRDGGRASSCPAWARSREAMRRLRGRRPGRRDPRARGGRRRRCSASASACSCSSSASAEHEGAAGLGLLPGEVDRRWRRRSCRTSAGTASRCERPRALTEGLGEAAAFYHVHSFVCRPARGRRRPRARRVRRAVRLDRRARQRLRRPVPPREVLRATGSRCWRTSPAVREGRGVILYPAIDILDGKAVRLVAGRLRGPDRLPRRPAGRPRSAGSRRARASCTSSTSTARAPARRSRSTTCGGSRASRRAGPVRRRPALAARGPRRAARGRGARDPRHGGVPRHRLPRRRRRRVRRRACSSPSTCAAATSRPRAGRRRRRCRPATRSGASATAACLLRLHQRRPRRHARGPRPRRRPPHRRVVRGRFLYSGGIGSLDDLRGARRAAPGQPRRRDRRQGALRGPLHRRRGPGGARARAAASSVARAGVAAHGDEGSRPWRSGRATVGALRLSRHRRPIAAKAWAVHGRRCRRQQRRRRS